MSGAATRSSSRGSCQARTSRSGGSSANRANADRGETVRLTRVERLVLVGPLAIVLAIWLVLPALLGLAATFTDYAPVEPSVHWVGLRNFAQILADRTFAGAGRNIAIFSVVAVPLQLALGFGLASLLRPPFRGGA